MQDLYVFIGREVQVTLYRKRYCSKDHVRVHRGRLTDIHNSMICLETNGKCKWISKPNMYKDSIKELKI